MGYPTGQAHDWRTFEAPYTQALVYNSSNLAEYIGFAVPGSGKGEAKWAIKKLTYNAVSRVTDIQWAEGNPSFGYIWNDRATYTYS